MDSINSSLEVSHWRAKFYKKYSQNSPIGNLFNGEALYHNSRILNFIIKKKEKETRKFMKLVAIHRTLPYICCLLVLVYWINTGSKITLKSFSLKSETIFTSQNYNLRCKTKRKLNNNKKLICFAFHMIY